MAMCFAVNCVAVEKLCVGNGPDFENTSRAFVLGIQVHECFGLLEWKKSALLLQTEEVSIVGSYVQ